VALPILSVPILILMLILTCGPLILILNVPIASLPILIASLTASLIARVPDGPAQTWHG
jgi:hypothetical protein